MAKHLLTDPQCKHATCEGKAIRKLPDGDGLYLWVTPDGAKRWRLRYWIAGKEKSLSLGVYPAISLKRARERCEEERKHLTEHKDPSAERKAENRRKALADANSFEVVARSWYAKNGPTWAPKHAADVLRRLELNIFPHIGQRPIGEIDPPELLAVLEKIEARGATDLVHRVRGVCGQVFRFGVAKKLCTRDIAADVRDALAKHKKQHQLAISGRELPALLQAIAAYDQIGDKQTKLALQLLALTFVRTNELINATWDEFDFEKAQWCIPAHRMKMRLEHIVPLAPQTLAILDELKKLSGGSRFILPGRSRDKPISNNTLLFALYRMGYKNKMTGHGFRAVANTELRESGEFQPEVIEFQLAHKEGAYDRAKYLKQRKELMAWWADYLDEAVKKGPA